MQSALRITTKVLSGNKIEIEIPEAKNLEQHQIEKAIGDRTTILPENLKLPEHWKAQVSPLNTET